MAVLDDVKELLGKYASGATASGETAAHFHQVAQAVDSGTLAGGIAEALQSDQTPPFPKIASQLFASGSSEQKRAMLNALVSAIPPDLRQTISATVPSVPSISVDTTTASAAAVSPRDVQTLADHAQKHDAGIIEKMSAVYAAHPTLLKALGTGAMAIAMQKIAEQRQNG
jgi:hypothetical protein